MNREQVSREPADREVRATPRGPGSIECGGGVKRRPAGTPWPDARRGLRALPKSRRHLLYACLLFSASSSRALPAIAQPVDINWHTIDGGGGTSTRGVYSVSGTVGQPNAGQVMTGGNYLLTGGSWSLYAIQTPGAPVLTIVPAGVGQAEISWTPDTSGFALQETSSLSSTNWMNSASGSTHPVVVPANVPTKFYRLFKP